MSDEELDGLIAEVNADLEQAIGRVVDTEGDLRRLKRRMAHRWVADVIEGALGNGSGDDIAADPAVQAEIRKIGFRHYRIGHRQGGQS